MTWINSPDLQGLPAASLIICSRNRPRLLVETVQSVLDGELRPAELVIIDQSVAPNPTLSDCNFAPLDCELRYIWSNTIGLSCARNEAIAVAKHELLVFVDDDMRVSPEWFRTIVSKQVAAGRGAVLTGRVLPGDAEIPGGFVPSIKQDEEPAVYRGRVGADILYPNNMSIFRSAFQDVGGFDERLGAGTSLPSSEDNDFCFRLLERGYSIYYVPEAVVYHRAWRNGYLGLRWSYGVGQGAFYAKYLSVSDPHMLFRMCRDSARRIRRMLGLSPRRYRTAAGDLVYLTALVKGMLWWLLFARHRPGVPPFQASATPQ